MFQAIGISPIILSCLKLSCYRSSHQRCSIIQGVLRNFAKYTGKYLCQSLFFKKEALAQVFSCVSCEISKNTIFTEHLWMTIAITNVVRFTQISSVVFTRHTFKYKLKILSANPSFSHISWFLEIFAMLSFKKLPFFTVLFSKFSWIVNGFNYWRSEK